ncbi:hypothetical protein GF324_12025 [bacterium]|nr:hypothetical protein [bacterium]
MAITFTYEVKGKILHVKTEGYDENLKDVLSYSARVVRTAIKHRTPHVFCDERDLEYRISDMESYLSAEKAAQSIPAAHRVAILCRPNQYEEAVFWELVASNRFMNVKIFTDEEGAWSWVKGEPK